MSKKGAQKTGSKPTPSMGEKPPMPKHRVAMPRAMKERLNSAISAAEMFRRGK